MTLNEAIDILVKYEQPKMKGINMRAEYENLCKISTNSFGE